MTPEKYLVVRELTDDWNKDVPVGTVVYRYHGHTYGCISPGGVAVSLELNQPPFFEVPAEALAAEVGKPSPVPDRCWAAGYKAGFKDGQAYGEAAA